MAVRSQGSVVHWLNQVYCISDSTLWLIPSLSSGECPHHLDMETLTDFHLGKCWMHCTSACVYTLSYGFTHVYVHYITAPIFQKASWLVYIVLCALPSWFVVYIHVYVHVRRPLYTCTHVYVHVQCAYVHVIYWLTLPSQGCWGWWWGHDIWSIPRRGRRGTGRGVPTWAREWLSSSWVSQSRILHVSSKHSLLIHAFTYICVIEGAENQSEITHN